MSDFNTMLQTSVGYGLRALPILALLWLLPMQAAMARNVSLASGNLQLDRSHGNGEAWGKSKCSGCHFTRRLHSSVPKIKAIVDKKGFTSCTGCHGSNGTRAERQCLTCHNSKDLPLNPLRGGMHRHDFNSDKDLKTTSKQCVVCHDKSDMDGKFELDQDLTLFDYPIKGEAVRYDNISEFCLRCHNVDHQQKNWPIKKGGNRDQSLRAEEHYQKIDAHGAPAGNGEGLYNGLRTGTYAYKTIVECTDCHTMHGTKNPNLIIEDSRQGVFLLDQSIREKGCKAEVKGVIVDQACKIAVDGVDIVNSDVSKGKVKVEKGDYRDLCVMCHSMTTVSDGGDEKTPNGLTGIHTDQGTDCKSCHSHGESVQKGL